MCLNILVRVLWHNWILNLILLINIKCVKGCFFDNRCWSADRDLNQNTNQKCQPLDCDVRLPTLHILYSERRISPSIVHQSIAVYLKLRSAAVSQVVRRGCQKKNLQQLYQTPNKCKKHPYMCVKKCLCRRINSFHNFLSYNHYFTKLYKLAYRNNVVTVTLTTGAMPLLSTRIHFWVCGNLRCTHSGQQHVGANGTHFPATI
jgi:hypothetical protein